MDSKERLSSVDFLSEAIADCFSSLRVIDVKPILNGWQHVLIEINQTWMFRFPRNAELGERLKHEVRLLPELATHLPVAVPIPEFVHKSHPKHPVYFVGYRKIPGESLGTMPADSLRDPNTAEQLATIISAIHRFPLARLVDVAALQERLPWRQEYIKLSKEIRRRVPQLLAGPLMKEASIISDAALDFFRQTRKIAHHEALIHGDFSTSNLLYDNDSKTVTGVIDWTGARIGDPAYDLATLSSEVETEIAEKTFANYRAQTDQHFWKRVGIYHMMIPLEDILYALKANDRGKLDAALRSAERSLSRGRAAFHFHGKDDMRFP